MDFYSVYNQLSNYSGTFVSAVKSSACKLLNRTISFMRNVPGHMRTSKGAATTAFALYNVAVGALAHKLSNAIDQRVKRHPDPLTSTQEVVKKLVCNATYLAVTYGANAALAQQVGVPLSRAALVAISVASLGCHHLYMHASKKPVPTTVADNSKPQAAAVAADPASPSPAAASPAASSTLLPATEAASSPLPASAVVLSPSPAAVPAEDAASPAAPRVPDPSLAPSMALSPAAGSSAFVGIPPELTDEQKALLDGVADEDAPAAPAAAPAAEGTGVSSEEDLTKLPLDPKAQDPSEEDDVEQVPRPPVKASSSDESLPVTVSPSPIAAATILPPVPASKAPAAAAAPETPVPTAGSKSPPPAAGSKSPPPAAKSGRGGKSGRRRPVTEPSQEATEMEKKEPVVEV